MYKLILVKKALWVIVPCLKQRVIDSIHFCALILAFNHQSISFLNIFIKRQAKNLTTNLGFAI